MKPFVKELAENLAAEIYGSLHDRGVEIPGEGKFCPACREPMTASCGVMGMYTKPGADLWLCQDCTAAMGAERRVHIVNAIRHLSWTEKVALVFNGKIPQSWLDEWHKHCRMF